MQRESSVSIGRHQIHALNRPFLDLLACCPAPQARGLGLSPDVTTALAAMGDYQRDRLATMPFLLAGIRSVPAPAYSGHVGEDQPGADTWIRDAQVYAAALLTFLWTAVHSVDPGVVFILGQTPERRSWLSGLSIKEISAQSLQAPGILTARLSHCAAFWQALVRAGTVGEADLPRLWMIPLVAAESAPGSP